MLAIYICLGVLGAAVFVLLFVFLPLFLCSIYLFKKQLVRTEKGKWTRDCSWPENAEQAEMFRRGLVWGEQNASYKKDVDVFSDGLHLFGEYYDYGYDRAVIIIPGRMEGCRYSYYFAPPYSDNGYNVLVVDNRAHGLSEGKYNCLGLKENRDILVWGKMLHEQFGVKEIVLHGICIGSATAIQALTLPECPDYFTAMVADGMYTTFRESFKNHVIELKHPTFPVTQNIMILIRTRCKVDVVHDGPIFRVGKLHKPILFLYTKQDLYSTPDDAKLLFDKCSAPKRIVWFDHGVHSHIRINDEEKYDLAIKDFLTDKDNLE